MTTKENKIKSICSHLEWYRIILGVLDIKLYFYMPMAFKICFILFYFIEFTVNKEIPYFYSLVRKTFFINFVII